MWCATIDVGLIYWAPVLSSTLARRIDQGEVPWPAGLDKVFLDLQQYLLWDADPHEDTVCDGISVLYDPHGLFCRNDLAQITRDGGRFESIG